MVKSLVLYLKRGDKEDGDKLFSVAAGDKTKSSGLKLQWEEFRLDVMNKFSHYENG